MKTKRFNIFLAACLACGGIAPVLTSCENGNQTFGDYDYQTVYFAYQNAVRTLTMGDDVASTELDNKHQFDVYVTLGGVESNGKDRPVTLIVDESLCEGLAFESNGEQVVALPSSYYTLEVGGTAVSPASPFTVTLPQGAVMGGVRVQLTDAFFADAKATSLKYVLPLKIVSADEQVLGDRNYTLRAVKYKNKWHGAWISRGTDEADLNGVLSVDKRHAEYLEYDEIRYITTRSLTEAVYNVSTVIPLTGTNLTPSCDLLLTFDDNDRCTVTTTTDGCTATGSGKWEHQGAKKAWADKDRDQLTLDYTVTYTYEDNGEQRYKTIHSLDTLVMRDRQNALETFTTK